MEKSTQNKEIVGSVQKMSNAMSIRSDICPTQIFKIDLQNPKLFCQKNRLLDKMTPKKYFHWKNALFLKSINNTIVIKERYKPKIKKINHIYS